MSLFAPLIDPARLLSCKRFVWIYQLRKNVENALNWHLICAIFLLRKNIEIKNYIHIFTISNWCCYLEFEFQIYFFICLNGLFSNIILYCDTLCTKEIIYLKVLYTICYLAKELHILSIYQSSFTKEIVCDSLPTDVAISEKERSGRDERENKILLIFWRINVKWFSRWKNFNIFL